MEVSWNIIQYSFIKVNIGIKYNVFNRTVYLNKIGKRYENIME